MKFRIAEDARPQLKTLLFATVLSIALWFIPFTEYLVYPFKLFVTFIHESCHVLAALITNSAVYSLTVSPDTSGAVLAAPETFVAALIISSAGYVGASAFGALMLILIRRNLQPGIVLAGLGIFIAFMTTVFGLLLPTYNMSRAQTTFYGL
ncbi:MAG: M50 family metallopeptidase, partial [Pyrinomonadaceae bacterium]|nr:M50 family metallopeptidase [Pyrinomonadaceae bacterium]